MLPRIVEQVPNEWQSARTWRICSIAFLSFSYTKVSEGRSGDDEENPGWNGGEDHHGELQRGVSVGVRAHCLKEECRLVKHVGMMMRSGMSESEVSRLWNIEYVSVDATRCSDALWSAIALCLAPTLLGAPGESPTLTGVNRSSLMRCALWRADARMP
jgi:hypothetical protein